MKIVKHVESLNSSTIKEKRIWNRRVKYGIYGSNASGLPVIGRNTQRNNDLTEGGVGGYVITENRSKWGGNMNGKIADKYLFKVTITINFVIYTGVNYKNESM